MHISVLQDEAWRIAEEKGFHVGRENDTRDDLLVRLCLIHSEVTEAVQLVKKRWTPDAGAGLKAEIGEELADVLIRLGDFAHCIGIDLQLHTIVKLRKNEARPKGYGTPHEGEAGGI